MKYPQPKSKPIGLAAVLAMAFASAALAQSDITQPGDPLIASSANSPGSEGVANAIDGKPTKYLNFDSGTMKPAGFVVSPSVGVTVVTGLSLQSANDAPDRDPKVVTLEGSNDDAIAAFDAGNWELINRLENIPAFPNRFQTQSFSFANTKPFKHYRWTVVETQGPSTCCFQIAEVELLGTLLAQDVTQPGDGVIASSSNSPGSEGVANAIDGKPTKYLNFDSGTQKPAGFVVTPAAGVTRLVGMAMQSANDAADRDPKKITLEGSNDAAIADFASGNWELIQTFSDIPAFTARFQYQYFTFDAAKPYAHYRWTVVETQGPSTCCFQIAEVELLGDALPPDVTQPGDPVIASSANSPGSEGVANAIDGTNTKYLNFDSGTQKPAGFIVSPSIGRTVVTGLTMKSANDAPDRDPKLVTLEGSNDETVSAWEGGTWELIVRLENIAAFPERFQTQLFAFDNSKGYKHYRWTVVETQGPSTCCFQIAEVEFLGKGVQDVTQPGDGVLASSANSPGSEGVANAIDGKPTKYLNFDSGTMKPAGFIVTPGIGATTIVGTSMQSANDAADRDPKVVTIEGSNDSEITAFDSGTWELIARLENIPAFPNRFQTQDFYFPNNKAYKHYRWTVVETQGPSTCCFQIAEVEFLAITEGAPPSARFTSQPVDTPVLEGKQATFLVSVNGPWPLQWLRNGQPIPGAVKTAYTTEPITPQNAGDLYACQIVGQERSREVKALIFTPSATKSIGISFRGGGANGAPTLMDPDDIAGLHPQAYWINAANAGSGSLPDTNVDPPELVVNSDNQETPITVEFATAASWGAGTGDASPTQRLLNGLVLDNLGGDPSTITFNGVPNGTHSVIVYVVSPPLQFQNVNYKIGAQTYYIRAMNSDEYNAAPGFYRGSSTDPNNPTVANFVRFDNVSPENGTITLTFDMTTGGYDRGTGVNGIQLILNAPPPSAAPAITADPQPTVVAAGGTARVSVTAAGNNLGYQWRKNGRPLPDGANISGATTSTLTIASFNPEEDAAVYSVAVFNEGGTTVSKNASVRESKFDIKDSLVGHWKLDETSGTTAANAIASGRSGAVTGTASWGAGQVANSFGFDGASYIFVDNYAKATKQIAAAAWVNVAAGATADISIFRNAQGALAVSGGAQRIVGQFEIGLVLDAADNSLRPMAAIGIGPNVARATGPTPFPTGSWHHIAFTADGAQLRLYVDGKEVRVEDYLADINPPDIPYLSIGARLNLVDTSDPASGLGPDGAAPNFLTGRVDDIALWTRALSGDEVSKIYTAGTAGQTVTTVIVEPPTGGQPGTLQIGASGGNVTITWDNGKLQTAASIVGPWTTVESPSPVTEAVAGEAKFYRTISP
ncbi:MAG: hypothetical protein L0Z50_23130 [Verrucomicrobiales bacterium]|nr:hypothetical protein [Verrucomicrobiales bacterium]